MSDYYLLSADDICNLKRHVENERHKVEVLRKFETPPFNTREEIEISYQYILGLTERLSNPVQLLDVDRFYAEVMDLADKRMEETGMVSGVHWNALREVGKRYGVLKGEEE